MAYTAAQAIEAIQGSDGNITVIASKIGCTRQTVYNLMDRFATVKEAFQDEREAFKDTVESIIVKKIREDEDNTMIIFYAKTQMKDRGYIERSEITGADGQPIQAPQIYLPAVADEGESENG